MLIESTGNGYLRRKAAQALLTADPEGCCARLQQTIEQEADLNFAHFLYDMIETNCR